MTYGVALRLNEGLVMLSDTRTNAGIDNFSRFKKMFTWTRDGERAISMMTSGNLAITQAVISRLQENLDHPKPDVPTIFTASTMLEVVELVGETMREVQHQYGPGLAALNESSLASIVVGGQRQGGVQRLFLVYAAGNYIEATEDTCFFQIGEHKYGKPILDQVLDLDMPLDAGVVACLLSMASTMRSNLSVGMPLDLAVIPRDGLRFDRQQRIEDGDETFRVLSEAWSNRLRDAFAELSQWKV